MGLYASPGPRRWWGFLALALLAPLAISGCGGGTGTLSGTVYYDGKPLKGGNVTFICTGKPSISTKINEDGRYQTEPIAVGPVTICVETESWNPRGKTMGSLVKPPPGQKSPAAPSGSGAEMVKRYVPIPLIYGDPEKTPLTYTVTRGSQPYDVKLEPVGGQGGKKQ
jgi:hypothetical protein